jgi:hypothetical protein
MAASEATTLRAVPGPGSIPGRATYLASVTDARRSSKPQRPTGRTGRCPGSTPWRGTQSVRPRGVLDRIRPCEGRGPGSTPGEDTSRRWSQTARQSAAGTARRVVRSKWVRLPPASLSGNYMQGLTSLGQRHAASRACGGCRVFRTWTLTKAMVRSTSRLAQWVEHQTDNLAVTGSTPVPQPGESLRRARLRPQQAQGWQTGRSVHRTRRHSLRRENGASGNTNEAMQCVDTAVAHAAFDGRGSASPRSEPSLVPGSVRKRPNDAVIATAQTALRIGTCDRRLESAA